MFYPFPGCDRIRKFERNGIFHCPGSELKGNRQLFMHGLTGSGREWGCEIKVGNMSERQEWGSDDETIFPGYAQE